MICILVCICNCIRVRMRLTCCSLHACCSVGPIHLGFGRIAKIKPSLKFSSNWTTFSLIAICEYWVHLPIFIHCSEHQRLFSIVSELYSKHKRYKYNNEMRKLDSIELMWGLMQFEQQSKHAFVWNPWIDEAAFIWESELILIYRLYKLCLQCKYTIGQ